MRLRIISRNNEKVKVNKPDRANKSDLPGVLDFSNTHHPKSIKTPHLVVQWAIRHWCFAQVKGFDPITLLSSLFKSLGIENESKRCSLFFDDILTAIVVSSPKNRERALPKKLVTRKLVELLPLLLILGQGNNVHLLNKLLEIEVPRTTARFISPKIIGLAKAFAEAGLVMRMSELHLDRIAILLSSKSIDPTTYFYTKN